MKIPYQFDKAQAKLNRERRKRTANRNAFINLLGKHYIIKAKTDPGSYHIKDKKTKRKIAFMTCQLDTLTIIF